MRDINTSANHGYRPTSTAGDGEPKPHFGYPAFICGILIWGVFNVLFCRLVTHSDSQCNLDLYVDSITVSSAAGNPATPAEWYVRFWVKTPLTGLNFHLTMIYARLFGGNKSLSTADVDSFWRRELVGGKPRATTAVFNTTAIEDAGGDGAVVWDIRVEAIAGLTPEIWRGGYLVVTCGDLPVRFWSDTMTGKVKGSLIGKSRQCDYSFLKDLQDYSLPDASEKKWH